MTGQPQKTALPAAAAAARRRAVAFMLLATFFWSIPALAIKYLTFHLDLPTQNFVRFVSAAAFLWAVTIVVARKELAASRSDFIRVIPAFLACLAYQLCYTRAFYMRNVLPGMAYMLIKSTFFFTALLSVVFFADERAVVRDRRFLVGAAFSLAGLIGFVLIGAATRPAAASAPGEALIWGILLILLSAVLWSLYTVLVKRLVRRGSPLVAYTYVCTLMTVAFTVFAFTEGNPAAAIPRDATGVGVLAIAIASGALCVGAAHVLYYFAIRTLGTSVCGTVSLSNTFIPPVLSAFFFNERFSPWVILAGLLLVAGAAFTLQARPSVAVEPEE